MNRSKCHADDNFKEGFENTNMAIRSRKSKEVGVRVLVFNASFNNISAISWRSALLVEEIGVPV